MKFYYEGKLIRTSKTHHYTHAVFTTSGKLFTCSSSYEGAKKTLQAKIAWWCTGAQNCRNAIKAIETNKKTYATKDGRNTYITQVTHSIESYQKELETIERIIADHRNYKIVELEARN